MPTQTWRVVITKLGTSDVIGEVEVDAANWMAALRVGRERLGETPTMPAGASCSVDGSGAATVLDPSARRKLVLTPLGPATGSAAEPHASVGAAPTAAASAVPQASSNAAPPAVDASPSAASGKKRKRFETVAFVPGHLAAAASTPPDVQAQSVPIAAPSTTPATAPSHAPTAHVSAVEPTPAAFSIKAPAPTPAAVATARASQAPSAAVPASAATAVAAAVSAAPARTSDSPGERASRVALEMIFERVAEPTAENPIYYRERAYFLPRGVSVQEAEAALRFELVAMQEALREARRGKLVNLAAFDHRWKDGPERPPIVALQWRDWRGEVTVDFPATRLSSPPPTRQSVAPSEPPAGHDDRLDEVFQGLAELSRLRAPVEGLDLAMHLLEHHVPSEALSACLYDINTDELRFVSVVGPGAAHMQGKAVARSAGLFGQALRNEHRSTIFSDVLLEPAFSPEVDARPDLDARSMLLSPLVSEGHLLGALQLINRRGAFGYNQADANVVGYVAERIAEFLLATRLRRRSDPPPPTRR